MKIAYIYILKCADNTYYTGVTTNLEKRLEQHQSGFHKDSYTHNRRPVTLAFHATFTDINQAIEKEKQIKNGLRLKRKL